MTALTTSKRKFNKILENLSASSSTTSLASLPRKSASAMSVATPQNEHPSKRSRKSLSGDSLTSGEGDRPETAASTSSKFDPSASSLSLAQRARSIRMIKKDKDKDGAEPKKAPNYTPWSHEHFVERMKTFADVMRWGSKPDKINEVEWAKRGWICENLNTVACKGGCEKRLVVKLEPKEKEPQGDDKKEAGLEDRLEELLAGDLDEALVDRYAKLIVEGHDEGCLWRKAGCKDDIYHVPMANYEEHAKPGLIERHKTLLNIRYKLPPLENLKYPGANPGKLEKALPEELTQPLSSENVESTTPSESTGQTDIEKRIELFALYGWYGEDRGKYSIVFCHECHQRVGLWMYLTEDAKLDLAECHRVHCPWINSDSQGGRPIWEQLQKCLLNRIRDTASSIFTTQSSEHHDLGETRPPSSAADSEQADKKRMSRLKKAMKSFGGRMKNAFKRGR